MSDHTDSELPEELKEQIRRDAEIKDPSPASVIGRYDDLDPSDLPAVRELIDKEANEYGEDNTDASASEKDQETSSNNEEQVSTPTRESTAPDFGEGVWTDADFTDPEDGGVYPPELDDLDKWMGAVGKQAFAPWADRDHPEADPDEDARWKWGLEANYADGPKVDEWVEMDPRIDGRAFIQLETDPYVFVDGDDVRCPETGEIHPAFRAILEHLGPAPADISTSGAGVHAHYRGDLPEEATKEPKIQLDDEPWGANDDGDLPVVEIYATKHLAITHGEHVPGTSLEISEWDTNALHSILDAAGELKDPDEQERPSTDRSTYDLDEYEPTATDADETTTDIRDIFTALDRLDPKRVADRTIVREWTRNRRSFLPVWGSSDDNGTANYVNDRVWHDTGHDSGYGGPVVMAAIDAGLVNHTGATPQDVRGETWFKAVDHLRDLGFSIPELDTSHEDTSEEDTETGRDLLELDVVVEPANALAAAAAIEPDDLDEALPELERDDVDDVAIAVALAEGVIVSPDEFPSDGRYTEAYYRARDHYGAPLPKYLDNSTLEEREDLVFAALERVQPEHILEDCQSEVTVEDPTGKAVAKLDPTWEDSESGERIVAGYGRGFYCAEHDVSFSPITLVALEHDLVDSEREYPRGGAFKEAYRLLREEYGAPLPKWRATLLEHVAVLPPAARLLGKSSADQTLTDARQETETLLRDAVGVRDRAQLVTNVPGTGKTFSSAIIADEHPILYAAQRNELKKQMEHYAEEISDNGEIDAEPTVRHLPILAEQQFDDAAISSGIQLVREHGRSVLREREELHGDVGEPENIPDEEGDDEDRIELDRRTCPTAEGAYGDKWAYAVQVARALGIKPSSLHKHEKAIFGERLPCQYDHDEEEHKECSFTRGWETVRDPDDSADILVGSPGHAFVDSATTYFDRAPDGERIERDRAVVVDEFLGGDYMSEYGDRYLDFASWLADALVGIDTREDLVEADLDDHTWLNLWLEGDGEEYADAADAIELLTAGRLLCTARREAEKLLEVGIDPPDSTSAKLPLVTEMLETLCDGRPTDGDLDAVLETLASAETTLETEADATYGSGDRADAGRLYTLAGKLNDVCSPLAAAIDRDDDTPLIEGLEDSIDDLPVAGDLRGLLEDAVGVLRGDDAPEGLLDAAITALEGGRDGCRELSIYAENGYAHPDAWALLAGVIARNTTVVESETFAFDGDDGSTFKRLRKNGATILADKNQHGAIVVDPPAFTDITGNKCPVIGLDATGRPELWKIALGRDVERRDIHDSDAERRSFLRDNGYVVVQTSNNPLPAHGNPEGRNFNKDLELVKTAAEEYTGDGSDAIDDKGPAVISTKKVLDHLEEDLEKHAGATVNYENMKGSDALGGYQVAVVLRTQHYGDMECEKWGLLAGESPGRGNTRGDTLDYGGDVANAYLKHMREDHTMQAILRAGRNEGDTLIFAHTSALRSDLPVVDEGVILSAHSKGTLAVAEAAKQFRTGSFTANDILEAIDDDDRAVGPRQVRNVLADLRESGYLQVVQEGGPGIGFEYVLEEEPGLADVELPPNIESESETSEKSSTSPYYMWNFRSQSDPEESRGMIPPSKPTIPARATVGGEAVTASGRSKGSDPPPDNPE